MSPFIKQLSNEIGKTVEEISAVWEECKKITADAFGISEGEFSLKEIEYTKEVVRNKLGVQPIFSAADFINSENSAKDFINEMTSGSTQSSDSFGINNTITKKGDEEKDDDDEDEKDEDTLKHPLYRDGTGPHGRGLGPGKGMGCTEDQIESISVGVDPEEEVDINQTLDEALEARMKEENIK